MLGYGDGGSDGCGGGVEISLNAYGVFSSLWLSSLFWSSLDWSSMFSVSVDGL